MRNFIIGKDNLGIGEITFQLDREATVIRELTITGNKEIFEHLSEAEAGEWSWALYPPELYFKEVPFEMEGNRIKVTLTEALMEDCDIALYLMEHNDVEGAFTIDENEVFRFKGSTYISGEKTTLELQVALKK